jgi:hypothetical protein
MITIEKARRWLADITAWRPLLDDNAATVLGVSSPILTLAGGSSGDDADRLPFHLDTVIDRTDEGATGIRTPRGLDEILMSWARQIATGRHDPAPLTALAYLQQAGVLEWAHRSDDWDALCETIRDAHTVIGRQTGHAPHVLARCPKCGGDITTDPTDHGIPDWGVCETCETWYGSLEDVARAERARLRDIAIDPGLRVTPTEALRLWPELTWDDLHNWTRPPRLPLEGDPPTVNLRALNQAANALAEKRSRPGWRRTHPHSSANG